MHKHGPFMAKTHLPAPVTGTDSIHFIAHLPRTIADWPLLEATVQTLLTCKDLLSLMTVELRAAAFGGFGYDR